MKTLEDLYKEVMASEELKKTFAQAAKDNKVSDFLKAQGCDATEDELKAFIQEKAGSDKPLSEDDLENVAGGRGHAGGFTPLINLTKMKSAIDANGNEMSCSWYKPQ